MKQIKLFLFNMPESIQEESRKKPTAREKGYTPEKSKSQVEAILNSLKIDEDKEWKKRLLKKKE